MTIQSAAIELRKDTRFIKGVAIGMGITLTPIASGICMSIDDYQRLRERVEADSMRPDPSRPVEV